MLLPILLLTALAGRPVAKDGVLTVKPGDSLPQVSQRLAKDPAIREVVLATGAYPGGFTIPALEKEDPEKHPLLIRAADGAVVLLDGGVQLGKAKAVAGRPGVYSAPIASSPKDVPQLWEPGARVRYLLAADLDAVQHFPASYIVQGKAVLFHTSDGKAPGSRVVTSAQDFGLSVERRFVTVRGLRFRNFLARPKWSAAVQARADHITVERCDVANASFGVTLLADDGALVDSTVRDVGGGVYLAAKRGRVERSRFIKLRDRFNVPTYVQDDTAIQAYYPAESGTIRGNLTVGFGKGVLIKAIPTPWTVEENTLVDFGAVRDPRGEKYGFLATDWHAESVFRHNVVEGYAAPVRFDRGTTRTGVSENCIGGDPLFVGEDAGDFRLAPGSPCLAGAGEGTSFGAGEIARIPDKIDLRAVAAANEAEEGAAGGRVAVAAAAPTAGEGANGAPRTWHVSPSGRDGAAGKADAPLRRVQEAVDRARPGDTILLQPGIYSEPVRFDHGGSEGKPITLRAVERWKAVLDGARRFDSLVRLDGSPFVIIEDLEIRWYRVAGVHVFKSPDVRVQGCRIWNAHWSGNWPDGDGVRVEESPRFTGTGNVLFMQERGFAIYWSPGATITRNTAVANLYGGISLVHSLPGSTCTNNSFAYQGNDAISISEAEGGKGRLAEFACDYNNYGVTLQGGQPGDPPLQPRPQDRHLYTESKAIVYFEEKPIPNQRFRTMAAWREFSGLDAHSIFADPLFVDSASGDFRVEAGSPNRGAGENGGTIGALGD
jgi:hypothetical protein